MAETSHFSLQNPWLDDDWSVGRLRNVMHLAERTGYFKQGHRPDREGILKQMSETSPSLQMIRLRREIAQKKEEVHKINIEILRHLQDKETKDLTHSDILEERVKKINTLNSHLQRVVGQKDQLISRLQQPFVGNFLKIDAAYHRQVSEFFHQMAPVLAELSSQLDNIEWAGQVDMQDGQLETLLSDISKTLATLQTGCQSLIQLRHATQQLHSQRAYPSTA